MTVETKRYFNRMGIAVEDHATEERRKRLSDRQLPSRVWWLVWPMVAVGIWIGIYWGAGWIVGRFLKWYWGV